MTITGQREIEGFRRRLENNLLGGLTQMGIVVSVAANDNAVNGKSGQPSVIIRDVRHISGAQHYATDEIEVLLEILGLPWQCGLIIDRLYELIGPEAITLPDLLVLMMDIRVLSFENVLNAVKSRVQLRYLVDAV